MSKFANGFNDHGKVNGKSGKFIDEIEEFHDDLMVVPASDMSLQFKNSIRDLVQGTQLRPNPAKPLITLSVGDPTIFGNLRIAEETKQAVLNAVNSENCNGYSLTYGSREARTALAKFLAYQGKVTADDIMLCNGASAAIDMCISAIANPGQNVLIPKPGYRYEHFLESYGIHSRYYECVPENNWEIDIKQMESLIDENTAAIIIANPSNPCGSVFSKYHLEEILEVAEKNFLPIISDEVYEHMVFPGIKYHAISSLKSAQNVNILCCSAISKRFLVPGWRLGWIVIHDRKNGLKSVRQGLNNLSARLLCPNTIVQAALPEILEKVPSSFFEATNETIAEHAYAAFDILKQVPGLLPYLPNGAMYMMIKIEVENFPKIKDDLQFITKLIEEQSVSCLPGYCFISPNFFRIVLTCPKEMIIEACNRIAQFCGKHYMQI